MAYEKKEYQESDAYNSAYEDTIANLVGKVSNGEKFNYNPLTDAAYQSYASQYNRLGKEARQNTLADVAINTGGLVSSYATAAAAQAQNQYNQALTDKIPELEALAYEKYNNERNYNLNALSALQSLEDSAYSKWADNRDYQRSKYEYDQNFDYQNYVDERNFDYQKSIDERDFAYQQDRDKVADEQWNKTYDLDLKNYKLNKQQQEWSQKFQTHQDEWQRMYSKWTTMGYANKQVAKYFGIKEGTRTSDQKYRDAQIAAMKSSSSGGSSGGSGGGSSSSGGGSSSKSTYSGGNNSDSKGLSKTAQDLQSRIAKSLMQNKSLPSKQYYQVTDNWLKTLVSYYNSGKITKTEYNKLKSSL